MPATIMIVTALKNLIVYRIRVENLGLTFGVLKTLLFVTKMTRVARVGFFSKLYLVEGLQLESVLS